MLPSATVLGELYTLSELALAIFKRARSGRVRMADRGSLSLLWFVILVSVTIGYGLAYTEPRLQMAPAAFFNATGTTLFAAGLLIRWYAIVYLGRLFTVNVAIADDHRLIDTGPYRYIRHPSYAGALMAFVGLGLCLRNWASLIALVVPPFLAFSWRIRIEEDALISGLGDTYREYVRRTKRLIPAVY